MKILITIKEKDIDRYIKETKNDKTHSNIDNVKQDLLIELVIY